MSKKKAKWLLGDKLDRLLSEEPEVVASTVGIEEVPQAPEWAHAELDAFYGLLVQEAEMVAALMETDNAHLRRLAMQEYGEQEVEAEHVFYTLEQRLREHVTKRLLKKH